MRKTRKYALELLPEGNEQAVAIEFIQKFDGHPEIASIYPIW